MELNLKLKYDKLEVQNIQYDLNTFLGKLTFSEQFVDCVELFLLKIKHFVNSSNEFRKHLNTTISIEMKTH